MRDALCGGEKNFHASIIRASAQEEMMLIARPTRIVCVPLLCIITLLSTTVALSQTRASARARRARNILWQHPGNIPARDLRFGPGSTELAPVAPFTFLEEDKDGESPKFEVRDARGVHWTVKLGEEAQAETVATRLVWSVGYFAEEAYYFDNARIENLPRLSRGQDYVAQGNTVVGARFEPKRQHVKRGPMWDWMDNPFEGTKELSGLKILMILLNNYDARKENNRILFVNAPRQEARYYVTDLGATLGRSGGLGGKRSKNNLKDFLSTRFVMGVEDGAVEFDYDTRPTKLGHLSVLYPPYYRSQVKKEKAMRGIPIAHARWIGSLLSQLTNKQLDDAFRAASYSEEIRGAYVQALQERIAQLRRL